MQLTVDKRTARTKWRVLLAVTMCIACSGQITAKATASTSSDAYVRAFGTLSVSDDVRVLRARTIFARLMNVVNRVNGVAPTLYVINSRTKPWAIAMPDGGIVLSRGVLDVCYQENDVQLGDTRLAFVLGHELSHLTSNDFWHRDVNLSFAANPSGDDVARIRDTLAKAAGISTQADVQDFFVRMRERELVADDRGFLYAAVSGYPVDKLLDGGNGGFLGLWVEQTRSFDDETHFSAPERTAFLAQRLRQLRGRSRLFDAAMRLGHFGHFDEAIALLTEFHKSFPSKEVLNNLGYFHLRKAMQLMPAATAYQWWFPTAIELELPRVVNTRGLANLPETAVALLQRAADYLTRAGNADPTHIPSRINLATTQYFLGNPHAARAAIEQVKVIQPENVDALMAEAPLLIAQNPGIDVSEPALKILDRLMTRDDAPSAVEYNRARILDLLGRVDDATRAWQRVAAMGLPAGYRRAVCRRLENADCERQPQIPQMALSVSSPIRFGADVDSADSRAALQAWRRDQIRLGETTLDVFTHDNGQQLVAMNAAALMFTSPVGALNDISLTAQAYGTPLSRSTTAAGDILHYSPTFALLTDGPLVRELWIAKPQ